MSEPLRIFIGFDPSESIAAYVLAHSIVKNASAPVAISFLRIEQLRDIHKRERHPLQSTDFSFTRFLVPYLSQYNGHAIFLDCDMLVVDDIYKLLNYSAAAVSVVKHDHKPKTKTKMLGQAQTAYDRKNWSSMMVFNSGHYACKALSPEIVDEMSGLDLHQFKWARDSIGSVPARWNHLVGYDAALPVEKISLLHWTEGGPWWTQYENAPYADVWRQYRDDMMQAWERLRATA